CTDTPASPPPSTKPPPPTSQPKRSLSPTATHTPPDPAPPGSISIASFSFLVRPIRAERFLRQTGRWLLRGVFEQRIGRRAERSPKLLHRPIQKNFHLSRSLRHTTHRSH